MLIGRSLAPRLAAAKRSFLLLGARQTGKSTLIRSLAPELEINLVDEETYLDFVRDPGLLKRRIRDASRVFIDEIQRIPSLLNTVQYLLDQRPAPRFLLTGSSARKLKRGDANLLPGRIFTYSAPCRTPNSASGLTSGAPSAPDSFRASTWRRTGRSGPSC